MGRVDVNPVDQTDVDWAMTLAYDMLEAAQSCGFDCGRVFVVDGQVPEGPPPSSDCQCQLAVAVTAGIDTPRNVQADWPCAPVFTAELVLTVDLCVLVAGQNEVLRVADIEARALENQTALWEIMQGLMSLRTAPELFGVHWEIDGWHAVGQSGGSARWQTRWLYRQ